jgi:DNA-binding NtrC family response regulator
VPGASPEPAPASRETGLKAVERELILKALRDSNWNQTKAARHLAISRKTLLYRMGKYGISKDAAEAVQSAPGE